jgi:hypothetical protein
VRPRLFCASLRLAFWRLRHSAPLSEGCPEEELKLEFECALLRGHLRERLRPRNYAYRSLVKRRPEMDRLGPVRCTPAPANE